MWIPRPAAAEMLLSVAGSFPVTVLTGPRQVGKTSLLENAFPTHSYVTLDLASTAETAETRPDLFLEAHPPPVIIDEVQYAPGLFRHLKVHVDRRRGENGLFLLSGSQHFALMERVSDSLAGRAAVIPFLGLSHGEWRAAFPDVADLEFVHRGSFPGLWAQPERPPDRNRWYQGYLATYLDRDVRAITNVTRLRDFERFMRACAVRSGSLANMADLARDVGISPTTARDWLSVLQASNQIVLLEPYHRSLGKRLVKSPKLYFTDSGLCAFLLGIATPEGLMSSPHAGAIFETYVIAQWLRWQAWQAPSASLWFWQDRNGKEVDLLVDYEGRLFPIEVKLTERPDRADAANIAVLRAFYGDELVAPGTIACLTKTPHEPVPGVLARPGFAAWDPTAAL